MTTDYKSTLNLPQTDFPMRGNLANREPDMVKKWLDDRVYQRGVENRKKQNAPTFILHDGPPYANGNIHHGHILNKVLKDFVVKYQNMNGKLAEFVPGWDCHGLPIEHQVDKKLGKQKQEMSKVEIRKACREYAEEFVDIQREEFKRVMVFADWDNPYKTMSYQYEAATVRELGGFMEKGLVYQGLKPVHWDWASRTALAEAEVEYAAHTTEHVYVKFKMDHLPGDLDGFSAGLDPYIVIWTTTPWTLPANLAIALHPELDYVLLQNGHEVYVIAEALVDQVVAECKLEGTGLVQDVETGEAVRFKGRELVGELGSPLGLAAKHPFIDRDSVLLPADYVTTEQGTGCVHTAPGHGQEDFHLGQQHGLDVLCPVDFRGCFIESLVPEWGGEHVFKANPLIVQTLDDIGALLNHVGDKVTIDRYPHGWRSKKPVIFRATTQFFIAMEPESAGNPDGFRLRDAALAEIEKVQWVPEWGKSRIVGMVENRPDWCISRQRTWGCPITALHCNACNSAIIDHNVTYHVAELIEEGGADVWFDREPTDLVPDGYACPHCGASPDQFEKEQDILDVWFDSGTSWAAVLERQLDLGSKADLYLEGSDQHRGWFQSSMLCCLGTRGHAPFDVCLTHGFVMDTEGRKYSKSSKNFESPDKMLKQSGAEILRLWVAAVDYRGDITLSPEIIKRVTDAYRKIRNTFRFLLGNLFDFDPNTDMVPLDELEELDRWLLNRTAETLGKVKDAYETYQFHQIFHSFVQLATVELSNVHMDISKDRLYCEAPGSKKRRSAQTAYFLVLDSLVRAMAPVLSFTCEEVWDKLKNKHQGAVDSVHLTEFPTEFSTWLWAEDKEAEWSTLLRVRSDVQKALEDVRVGKGQKQPGQIGSSQEAHVTVFAHKPIRELLDRHPLAELFIVSTANTAAPNKDVPDDGWSIASAPTSGAKCDRCWNYWVVGRESTLCPRCEAVEAKRQELKDLRFLLEELVGDDGEVVFWGNHFRVHDAERVYFFYAEVPEELFYGAPAFLFDSSGTQFSIVDLKNGSRYDLEKGSLVMFLRELIPDIFEYQMEISVSAQHNSKTPALSQELDAVAAFVLGYAPVVAANSLSRVISRYANPPKISPPSSSTLRISAGPKKVSLPVKLFLNPFHQAPAQFNEFLYDLKIQPSRIEMRIRGEFIEFRRSGNEIAWSFAEMNRFSLSTIFDFARTFECFNHAREQNLPVVLTLGDAPLSEINSQRIDDYGSVHAEFRQICDLYFSTLKDFDSHRISISEIVSQVNAIQTISNVLKDVPMKLAPGLYFETIHFESAAVIFEFSVSTQSTKVIGYDYSDRYDCDPKSIRVKNPPVPIQYGTTDPTKPNRPVSKDDFFSYVLEPKPFKTGGQAEIFKALYKGDNALVAIKKFKRTDAIHRGRREISVLKSLSHPNVIPIVGGNAEEGWYAMPLCDRTLQPSDQLGDWLPAIISALEYLQNEGLVHRDVKPLNILKLDDRWVLSDFGLVRRPLGETTNSLTSTETPIGTLGFNAPETFDSDCSIDFRADLFSLGKVVGWYFTQATPVPGLEQIPDNQFADIIKRMTSPQVSDRPDYDQVREAFGFGHKKKK